MLVLKLRQVNPWLSINKQWAKSTHNGSCFSSFAARGKLGFSLIEIALAIGIFAFAVLIILGLFASLTKDSLQSKNDTQLIGLIGYIDSYVRKSGTTSAITDEPYFYFNIDSSFLARSTTPLATVPSGAFYQVHITDASPVNASTPDQLWTRHRLWRAVISYPSPALTSNQIVLVSQPLYQ